MDERGILNKVLRTLSNLRDFDLLIFLGSADEGALLEKTLGTQVFSVPVKNTSEAGSYVEPQEIENYLAHLIPTERGKKTERGSKRKFRFFKKGSRGTSRSAGPRV